MCEEFVSVKRDAVDWLKKHYPALCEKSGLCENIGGKLYTRTTLLSTERAHISSVDCWCKPYQPDENYPDVWVHNEMPSGHA